MKKETYKKVMNKIKLPLEKKEEIYEKIMSKQRKMPYLKPIFITSIISLVVLVGALGTVYAEDIKEAFKNIINPNVTRKENKENKKTEFYSNGISEINYDADIPETKQYNPENPVYTYEELETKLGIPFLKSEYMGLQDINLSYVAKEKGKLAEAKFSIANYGNGEKPKVRFNFSFAILTKYADKEKLEESRFRAQGNFENKEHYINALNTTAYIIKSDNTFTALFDYQSVRYTLQLTNRQIYETIEEERNKTWEYGIQILESLYL